MTNTNKPIGDNSKELDQFFTNPIIAKNCIDKSIPFFKEINYNISQTVFLEPSAGDGAFIAAGEKYMDVIGLDLEPQNKKIYKNDFLTQNIKQKNNISNLLVGNNFNNNSVKELPNRNSVIVIGNPPFGKRAKLAIDFVNKAFEYSDTVAFILPLTFQKYLTQKQIDHRAKLLFDKRLPEKSFIYNGKPYGVRCCWQIWTLKQSNIPDLRIKFPPQIKHPLFEMFQYNNTKQAEKYFNKEKFGWDFAVPRQGYKDYSVKEINPDNLDKKTQWIFFKAKSNKIKDMLYSIDFVKLSQNNTSVPGFGKHDVVKEFNNMFPDIANYDSNISTFTQTFQFGEPKPNLAETFA
jgi:predicted RNA methylase